MAALTGKETEKQSDETFHLLCSPCKRKERKKEAEKYCADCNDYYCSDCVKCHDDIPALSGHKILEKGEVKDVPSGSLPVLPTQRCERHSFKPFDMYCQNHDEVGCLTCIATDHRTCQDVYYIPEYVLENDPTEQHERVQKNIIALNDEIKHKIEIRQQEIKRLLKRKQEEVEKVKQVREDLNRKLDILEKKSIDAIEDSYKALIKRFEDENLMLTTVLTDFQSATTDKDSCSSNLPHQFVYTKLANCVTDRAKENEKASKFKLCDIFFDCKQELVSMIDQMEMLGEIIEKPNLYKLEEKREINIKHESESKNCSIPSICILNDGSVIIADGNNETLKRLNGSSFKIEEVYKLPISPWQICRVDKDVAISSGGRNINFVTTEGTLALSNEMKTDHACYGLGYNNGMIYVTDSKDSIFVYNTSGTKLAQHDKDHLGKKLFCSMYSLTVSQDGEKIYVADHTYGLVVLSKEGKLLEKRMPSNLKWPREICEMECGDIMVCGQISNNILQFSKTGELIGEVLLPVDDNKVCRSVSLDRNTSRLIVGRSSGNDIEVYNMIYAYS